MSAFFIRDCVRCGVRRVQHLVCGEAPYIGMLEWEIFGACLHCRRTSVYAFTRTGLIQPSHINGNVELGGSLSETAIKIATNVCIISEFVPQRIADLFKEANACRQMEYYNAAGSMFRKTLDVATKHIYTTDSRLSDKNPAQALRARIKHMGEMKILNDDIVELADVAALDGNDAAHDTDPYTREEAEALEELTLDLLERMFVRPARIAAVKAKQVSAGVRPT